MCEPHGYRYGYAAGAKTNSPLMDEGFLGSNERLENSHYILLRIPIEFQHLGHGEILNCMDGERLLEELGITS